MNLVDTTWNVYTSPYTGLQMFVEVAVDVSSSATVRGMTRSYWGKPKYRIKLKWKASVQCIHSYFEEIEQRMQSGKCLNNPPSK